MKDKSNVETIKASSLGLQASWEEKAYEIRMKGVTFPEASYMETQVHFG